MQRDGLKDRRTLAIWNVTVSSTRLYLYFAGCRIHEQTGCQGVHTSIGLNIEIVGLNKGQH